MTRMRTPPWASVSQAASASKTVTPAATTVAASAALWRRVLDPPMGNRSSAA